VSTHQARLTCLDQQQRERLHAIVLSDWSTSDLKDADRSSFVWWLGRTYARWPLSVFAQFGEPA